MSPNIIKVQVLQAKDSTGYFVSFNLFLIQVLVDAECTHDGSIKHIQKYEFWGWKTLQRRVLDAERTDNLLNLQVEKWFLKECF